MRKFKKKISILIIFEVVFVVVSGFYNFNVGFGDGQENQDVNLEPIDDLQLKASGINNENMILLHEYDFEDDIVGLDPTGETLSVSEPLGSGTSNIANLGDEQQNHVAVHKSGGLQRVALIDNISHYDKAYEAGMFQCKIYHDDSLFGILFYDSIGTLFRLDMWNGNIGLYSLSSVYTTYAYNTWYDVVVYFNISRGWMFDINGVRFYDDYSLPFEHGGSTGLEWIQWCSAFNGGGNGYFRVDDIAFYGEVDFNRNKGFFDNTQAGLPQLTDPWQSSHFIWAYDYLSHSYDADFEWNRYEDGDDAILQVYGGMNWMFGEASFFINVKPTILYAGPEDEYDYYDDIIELDLSTVFDYWSRSQQGVDSIHIHHKSDPSKDIILQSFSTGAGITCNRDLISSLSQYGYKDYINDDGRIEISFIGDSIGIPFVGNSYFEFSIDKLTCYAKYIPKIEIISPESENITYTRPMSGYYPEKYDFNYNIEKGNYYGTYSFENDVTGGNPSGLTVVETGGTVNVINDLDGHDKVVDLHDTGVFLTQIEDTFNPRNDGTIELWIRTSNTYKSSYIQIYRDSSLVFDVAFLDGSWNYWDGVWHTITSASSDTWYHVRIDFDCHGTSTTDNFYLYINGVQYGPYLSYHKVNDVNKFLISTDNVHVDYHTYIDAIGYSWDDSSHDGQGYEIGQDNYENGMINSLLHDSFTPIGIPGTTSVSIVEWLDGREKVLELADHTSESYAGVVNSFDSNKMNGTVEWCWRVNDATFSSIVTLEEDSARSIYLGSYQEQFYYENNLGQVIWVAPRSDNTWYHNKIVFDCTNYLSFDWYIDGVLVVNNGMAENDATCINSIQFRGHAGVGVPYMYIDAVEYSWGEAYKGLIISSKIEADLIWMGYSKDGQSIKKVLNNTAIPLPTKGNHSFQLFGFDGSGFTYKSDIEYILVWEGAIYDEFSIANQDLEVIKGSGIQFSCQIDFSVKNNHNLTDNSNLLLNISQYYNPSDEKFLRIFSSSWMYANISLPRSDEISNITLIIPIKPERLNSTVEVDGGITYNDTLLFDSEVLLIINTSAILSIEDKCTQEGVLMYDRNRGYIDFTITADTYRGTPWIGSRVEINMPLCLEMHELGIDTYYDEFWTVNRIEFPYEDISFELDLPYEYNHETHRLHINDTDLNVNDPMNKTWNPFMYRVFFNKKPMAMNLYIQSPNDTLGNEVIQTDLDDYKDYSLYCNVSDPDPFINASEVPYFMNSANFDPYVSYIIDNQYSAIGNLSEMGINVLEFEWNLVAGLGYDLSSTFNNTLLEPVYNSYLDVDINFDFYEQPHFEITYPTDTIYMGMGSDLTFDIQLISPDGSTTVQDISIEAENASWDSHDSASLNLSIFESAFGKIYNNYGLTPSTSETIALLSNLTYPYDCLIVAPEILEYDSVTNFSRQQIELQIVLDLTELLEMHDLDPYKDLSLLRATIFGSSFIDTVQDIDDINEYYGSIDIFNAFLDDYEPFIEDNIFTETLEYGNVNNELKIEDLSDYEKVYDFDQEIWRYIDQQNRITFRLTSYFEGIISNPDTYLSTYFNEPNAVLGALIDYVNFDVVWWKEPSDYIQVNQQITSSSNSSFGYMPHAPGNYTISFEFDNNESGYLYARQDIEIYVKRRPVSITLGVPSEGYTTGTTILNATVTDLINGTRVLDAKVLFHSIYNGSDMILGSALTDINNVATLEVTNLPLGEHLIWAETMIDTGRYMFPYADDPFKKDYFDHNMSISHPLFMHLSQSSLELISFAPEGYEAIVGQNLYIYPKLMDLYNNQEVFDELIDIYIDNIFIGTYNSGHAFLTSFSVPGQLPVEGMYKGTDILNESSSTSIFDVRRLLLTFTDISPQESLYYPEQEISITVSAFDLTNQSFVSGLDVFLYNNVTSSVFVSGVTNVDGTFTFIFTIPTNWSSLDVVLYAFNSPVPNVYLQQETDQTSIKIRPYNVSLSIEINDTNLFLWENYEFNFTLWNLDTHEYVDDEIITFRISDNATLYQVMTSDNNSFVHGFSDIGIYYVYAFHEHTELYMFCDNNITFEIQKRPTHITVDITDKDLVPGNNFSITVDLVDSLSNQTIDNKNITVLEKIYDNGTMVEIKDPFQVKTQWTNTFLWIPFRTADFEFIFLFEVEDHEYRYSNHSILLSVKKRKVVINSYINSTTFNADDFIQINTIFLDLNTTNLDPISGLVVHHLIQEGDNILYSQNHSTNENGTINFAWQIPSNLINKSIKILIISAETNYYQWNGIQYEFITSPLESFFNITSAPNYKNYVNGDTVFNIELFSIRDDIINANISYEIICEENSYYMSGLIDLNDNSLLNISLSEPGIYFLKFYYNGSQIYAPTETEILYYIELFPCSLNLISYPEFVYTSQQTINLTYQLIDSLSQEKIIGSVVRLYYIDFNASAKVYLGLEKLTDSNGNVNFLVNLPDDYNYTSIMFFAEVNSTTLNEGSSNTFEMFITPSPTYIDINAPTDSIQFYLYDTLNISFELYDYFENLLDAELLHVDIETPIENITIEQLCNVSMIFNFTEFGLYKINVTYRGSDYYLPSSAQIYFAVSPVPTSLNFVEDLPDVFYMDEYLFLQAQLKNNLTGSPLEGKTVKFYIANETSTILIYNGSTDMNGFISYVWGPEILFIDQNITVFATYDYEFYYENSMTQQFSTYLSRYSVGLQIIEFPEMLYPLTEEQFIINIFKQSSIENAENCHVQVFVALPNGTRVLVEDGFTDNEGLLSFYWTPSRFIFDYSDVTFEIYVIEDEHYHGGLIASTEIPIDKIQTYLSIIPDKSQTVPGEIILLDFNLINSFGEQLVGQIINVEIRNVLVSYNITIEIGYNDTYDFTIPDVGTFEIFGTYGGDDRSYSCLNNTFIYSSEKFEVCIDFDILESFTRTKTDGFLGLYWNYSIFDYLDDLTLIANLTLNNTTTPIEGIEICFYFIQEFKDPVLLGSNVTDNEGIATFNWNISIYSTPNWWSSSATFAKIEENEMYNATESEPLYITLRKIYTSISIDTSTSIFRIDAQNRINTSLVDENLIELIGFDITIDIYDPDGMLAHSYNILTNETTYINFIPTKLGEYEIVVTFSGTEQYYGIQISEAYTCMEKERTSIKIELPDEIIAGVAYNITIELTDSSGNLLIGEQVKVRIMYHDVDSGKTEYFSTQIIMGENNTFIGVFPDYDEFIIKAMYYGSDNYKASQAIKISSIFVLFEFRFWEILFFLFTPCCLIFRKKKPLGYGKKKKKTKAIAFALVFVIIGSVYAGIAFNCSQAETTGLIRNLNGESNYYPENGLSQQSGIMDDAFSYGSSMIGNINPELIPNLENNSSPYDMLIENSTIIPLEADTNLPYLRFAGINNGDRLFGQIPIEVVAFDRESGIQKVLFKLFSQGIDLVLEGEFEYNQSLDLYVFELNTMDFNDGEYEIYAMAFDNNNNSEYVLTNIDILNHLEFDLDDVELDYVIAELTDTINVSFITIANGYYTILIKDSNHKIISSQSGYAVANKTIKSEIQINPLYFKPGYYYAELSVYITNILGIVKTEKKRLNIHILKESVRLELDVIEGEEIFSNRFIHFRARLIESDGRISESGEIIESELKQPIPGQILTFKIADPDNHQILGTVITDIDGYATFVYKVDLSKGLHVFNVSYNGNNLYKPLEEMKLLKNQGSFTQIGLSYTSTPVAYNNFATITAHLSNIENEILSNQTLYFNISSVSENIYLGMAMTDSNGEATIDFLCNYLPGEYDVIVSYDGNSIQAENISVFNKRLEILKQDTALYIPTGGGSVINCPLKYDTELTVKLSVNHTRVGIEGLLLNFELLSTIENYSIGSALTDFTGFASITFNPLNFNLTPGNYILNVYCDENSNYKNISTHRDLTILSDVPLLTINSIETYFLEEFQINATLTDSKCKSLIGKTITFRIIDPITNTSYPKTGIWSATTDNNGLAVLNVPANYFNLSGTFDIVVEFGGDNFEEQAYNRLQDALIILPRETCLYIQGPNEEIPVESLDVDLYLTDNRGRPIGGQKIFLECSRENGGENLLDSGFFVRTSTTGNISFSLPILLPDQFILHAYYRPQEDNNSYNDGFLGSQAEFKFKIIRIPADLMVQKINLPPIMRGDTLEFTVISKSKIAQDYIIPVRLFVDGEGHNHTDVLGEIRIIDHGIGMFSYEIPLGPEYQAGNYTFTIEIQPGTLFEGNTSVSIDLVERTTLSFEYNILNDKAQGKHYIWETEEIIFTLLDEDGDPLPETCCNEIINRWINYSISNGKLHRGAIETYLNNGSNAIFHIPDSYGFESCNAISSGSRFFAPAKHIKRVPIIRRPLVLRFIDYHHDNPERPNLPYTGHRGEHLTIYGQVQDYLNGSYLKNQEVYFGFNDKYLDISAISDEDGNVIIEVPLIKENGLIQSGIYNLGLKIILSDKFQSIKTVSSNLLYVFEIGSVKFNVGTIRNEDMNYVLRPTIMYYDEDNQIVSNIPFYIQVIDKKSKEVVFEQFAYSGKVDIPMYDGGKYDLVFTISDQNTSTTNNIQDMACYYPFFKVICTPAFIEFLIVDIVINALIIPILSEILHQALWKSVDWKANIWTFLILLFLNIIMSFIGSDIRFTWSVLLRVLLLSLLFWLFNFESALYIFLSTYTLIIGLSTLVGVMNLSDWLWAGVCLVVTFGIGALIEILLITKGTKESGKPEDPLKKLKFPNLSIVLIELGILCLWGLVKFVGNAWWIFKDFMGNIVHQIWMTFHKYKYLIAKLSLASALIAIIIMAISETIITHLLYAIFPEVGGFLGIIYNILRTILKSAIMAGLFIITASILMPVTEPISMIIKFFAEKIIGSWFEKSLKLMLEPAIKGLLESTDMPHAYS